MKKKYHILKNEEFRAIRKKDHALVCPSLILYIHPKAMPYARFGLSVSKKLGNAVIRNHIKRQLRMIIHETVDFSTYPFDVIVIARKHYLSNDFATNKKFFEKLLFKAIME